jgi:hypothetical protein
MAKHDLIAEPDLNAVAFPKLTEGQMAQLGSCAEAVLKRYRDGEPLILVGAGTKL